MDVFILVIDINVLDSRLLQMRVEHEAHKRKAIELEVKQLRDQISELLNRITRKPIYNCVILKVRFEITNLEESWEGVLVGCC